MSGGVKAQAGAALGGVAAAVAIPDADATGVVDDGVQVMSRSRINSNAWSAAAWSGAQLALLLRSDGGVGGDAPLRHCFLCLPKTSNTLFMRDVARRVTRGAREEGGGKI